MGLPMPPMLRDEITHGSPHLRVILPAAAAVYWVFKRITGRGHEPKEIEEEHVEDTGKPVEVSIPRSRGPKLPYKLPEGLKVVLLDVTLNTTVQQLWDTMLASSTKELVKFHDELGDKETELGSWREQEDGSKTRVITFTTPLKNPIGPKQARNKEVFTISNMVSNGFTLKAHCTSQGVPFSSCFANNVQWVATEVEPNKTRLIITGECTFYKPVYGMGSTISKESIKGMSKAYVLFRGILTSKFGEILDAEDTSKQMPESQSLSSHSFVYSITQTAQTNPAILIIILASFLLIWRMALMNSFYAQLARRLTQVATS